MTINKYDIEYSKTISKDKPIFVFVNHKTAILCWAQIKKLFGQNFDVITFDSHRDFRKGVINGDASHEMDLCFGSKYLTHLQPFTNCKEFLDWNLLDDTQNSQFIKKDRKFLLFNNDNFIDVAFMKNVVGNVDWYYLNSDNDHESGKCEDVNGRDHFFRGYDVKKFKEPSKPFILDIDLDFFIKSPGLESSLVSTNTIKKYLKLQKNLFLNDLCMGLSIALEPGCCGGEDNCLKILDELCQEFKLNLLPKSKELIRKSHKH